MIVQKGKKFRLKRCKDCAKKGDKSFVPKNGFRMSSKKPRMAPQMSLSKLLTELKCRRPGKCHLKFIRLCDIAASQALMSRK